MTPGIAIGGTGAALLVAGGYDEIASQNDWPTIWDGRDYPVSLLTLGNTNQALVSYINDNFGLAANDAAILLIIGVFLILIGGLLLVL